MTVSIIQKSADSFTDQGLPKLSRDLRINAGSQFRLDFTSAYTLNGAVGAIGAGAVMKNLVDNQPDLTFAVATGATVVAGNKGINNAAASTNGALFGGFPAGSFDMHDAGDHSFIVHLWANQDATGQGASPAFITARDGTSGPGGGAASPIWGASPSPVTMLADATGLIPGAYTRANGGVTQVNATSGAMVGAATLISYAWTPSTVSLFKNGVLVGSAAPPLPTVPSMRSHAIVTASANPADGDTITVNGTALTFKAVVTNAATQIAIGSTSAVTMANLRDFILANRTALNARAETGGSSTIVNIFRQDASLLTLTASSAALTVSGITNPYAIYFLPRGIKGTMYGIAMDDLTVAGLSPSQAAAAEYASTRAMLTAAGIT